MTTEQIEVVTTDNQLKKVSVIRLSNVKTQVAIELDCIRSSKGNIVTFLVLPTGQVLIFQNGQQTNNVATYQQAITVLSGFRP